MDDQDRLGNEQTSILLVDDIRENLHALDALLQGKDLLIVQARSGAAALDAMLDHDFALALLDVQMPEMSGFELAEIMRGTNRTKQIPIIFVTANSKEANYAFKGYETGAVDFLPKPLDPFIVKSKVKVFVDLHRQKNQLKRQLEKLNMAQASLRETQLKLESAVKIRDEFLSVASHELKTPLTALKLQVQIRERRLSTADSEYFSRTNLAIMFSDDNRQIERITRLIDDMLDITRIESGKLSMEFSSVDVHEMLKSVVGQFAEQLAKAGCGLIFDVHSPLEAVWDKFRIEQVIANLMSNAIRYGAGGDITISALYRGDMIEINVRDQGRGIASADLERIFGRFERACPQNEIGGIGLGLYIVRQIVNAHGGTIVAESGPTQGSNFRLNLPRKPVR